MPQRKRTQGGIACDSADADITTSLALKGVLHDALGDELGLTSAKKTEVQDRSAPGSRGGFQPTLRFHVLGVLRATDSFGRNALPRGRKARAALGYLCLNAGRSVALSRLASLLWDRVGDRQARSSLRQALRDVTRALGCHAAELIITDVTITLQSRLCWIDIQEVFASEPLSSDLLADQFGLLSVGEVLEGLDGIAPSFDHWLAAERSRFREQFSLKLETELHQHREADPSRRAALARRLISFDATHEGASRVLMRALADMGERAQALREYERCRSALGMVLDVEPSRQTRALCQALRMSG